MTNKMKTSLLTSALTAMLIGSAGAQQLESVDSIVAVVEEDVILRSELERSLATVLAQIEASGPAPSARKTELIKPARNSRRSTGADSPSGRK